MDNGSIRRGNKKMMKWCLGRITTCSVFTDVFFGYEGTAPRGYYCFDHSSAGSRYTVAKGLKTSSASLAQALRSERSEAIRCVLSSTRFWQPCDAFL